MGGHNSATESIVFAVADAEDVSPVALPPLYEVIDTDALDELFATGPGSDGDSTLELCFHYSNSVVTIDGARTVDVAPRQPLVESASARQGSD